MIVGVGVKLGVNVSVGVKVLVNVGVNVGVSVLVGVKVFVQEAAVSVAAIEVWVATCSGLGLQAASEITNNPININAFLLTVIISHLP